VSLLPTQWTFAPGGSCYPFFFSALTVTYLGPLRPTRTAHDFTTYLSFVKFIVLTLAADGCLPTAEADDHRYRCVDWFGDPTALFDDRGGLIRSGGPAATCVSGRWLFVSDLPDLIYGLVSMACKG